MTNNENQYTIYIRSTKESIPVSKEEFDAYYHDINIYRIRQQRHGRCVCPASKRLTCDMDCLTCPFHRMGDMRSLDYTETDDEGNETAWVDEIPDDSPLLEDIIIEASEMKTLYARLTELMPEAVKAVIDYCFRELSFDYLTCGHFDCNDRSRRVVEKSGFRFLKKVVTSTARGVDEPGKLYVLYNPMKHTDKEKQPCLN